MKGKKNYISIGLIFLITCIILSCLFFNDRYRGHDTLFHVSNIIRLSKTISMDNIFGLSIMKYEVPSISYGYFGYGIGLFYPRIPHLVASYIYLLFDDIYLSMKIVYFITTFLSGVFAYYLSNKIYNNKIIGLLSAILYLTVPYHICEIYIRDAFAENFMFMVLPMIFLGLYNLKDGNYKQFYILFILGYVIGINSHLISMFFYTFLIGIFIICYRKYFFNRDKFMALVKSALIVTIMVSPFIITLLEHRNLGIYRVFSPIFAGIMNGSIINFSSLFTQQPIVDDIMLYFNYTTIILFIMTTFSLFFVKKDESKNDKKIILLMMFIIVNLLCSNIIWDNVSELFLSIEFPWRLMVLMSLLVSLYVPGILLHIDRNKFKNVIMKYVVNIGYILLFLLIIVEGYFNIRYYTYEEVKPEEAMNSKVGFGFRLEYFPKLDFVLPLFGNQYLPDKDYKFSSNKDISIEVIKDDFPSIDFEVSGLDSDTIIEMPRTFYLGYELVNENDDKIKLDYNGNMLLSAVINDNGIYKLRYKKTVLVRIVEIIRTITLFVMGLVLVVKLIKWKRKRLQY